MEMSKKYIKLCSLKEIQALCTWNAGDRFLIKSQEVFSFLEKNKGFKDDAKCMVWVPNYDSNFEIDQKDLLWIPNLSQVVSLLKKTAPDLSKMAIEYIGDKWSCSLHYPSHQTKKIIPIVTFAKTGKTACIKALVTLIRLK
ncbi:MAG: hypothetical protein K9H14_02820 [Actinomycetia bacterium]|nr:hypothetical protein [Actinomycetes bacterium]